MKKTLVSAVLYLLAVCSVEAALIEVEITGQVSYEGFSIQNDEFDVGSEASMRFVFEENLPLNHNELDPPVFIKSYFPNMGVTNISGSFGSYHFSSDGLGRGRFLLVSIVSGTNISFFGTATDDNPLNGAPIGGHSLRSFSLFLFNSSWPLFDGDDVLMDRNLFDKELWDFNEIYVTRFTMCFSVTGGSCAYATINNISVTKVDVPEPSTLVVLLSGLALLRLRRD